MIKTTVIILLATIVISFFWLSGIAYMHENHPEYNGEDLFNPDDETDKTNKTDKDENYKI